MVGAHNGKLVPLLVDGPERGILQGDKRTWAIEDCFDAVVRDKERQYYADKHRQTVFPCLFRKAEDETDGHEEVGHRIAPEEGEEPVQMVERDALDSREKAENRRVKAVEGLVDGLIDHRAPPYSSFWPFYDRHVREGGALC